MCVSEQSIALRALQAGRVAVHRKFINELQELQQKIQESLDKELNGVNKELGLLLANITEDIDIALARRKDTEPPVLRRIK